MNPLPWFKTAGYLITTRHNRKGAKYNHNEHLPHGGWFIPVLDYTDELNIDIMKVIKKHFDTSNGVLELPYAFAGKDIPELHEIAGKPSLLAQKWFEDRQSEEEETPPTQDDGKTLPHEYYHEMYELLEKYIAPKDKRIKDCLQNFISQFLMSHGFHAPY